MIQSCNGSTFLQLSDGSSGKYTKNYSDGMERRLRSSHIIHCVLHCFIFIHIIIRILGYKDLMCRQKAEEGAFSNPVKFFGAHWRYF